MITQDRLDLNNRFIRVYSLLEERGAIIKNDRDGKGVKDFSERILGNKSYGHIVSAFLNPDDKRVIDYHHARLICKEYGVNEKFLLEGNGSPFGFEVPKSNMNEAAAVSKGNILYTSVEAFAGSTIGQSSFEHEDLNFFSIPGVSGNGLVAFPIKGNSMEPVILNGDIVICREVDAVSSIKENEMYAVKMNGSLWVKYVQKQSDDKGRVSHLKLISANHLEHDPFEEEVNEFTRIYKVIRKISVI